MTMQSMMMLAEGYLGWPQYIAIIALVALIIFYVQYRKRQM